MASQKKQSVLNGAVILMVAVVSVKVIGALFKMPLTDMLGTVGRGYFQSAYEIYTPIFAISMAGLPVAVSRHTVPLQRREFRPQALCVRLQVPQMQDHIRLLCRQNAPGRAEIAVAIG